MFQTTNQYINNQQIFGRVSKSGINWKRAIYPSIPQEIMFSCWPHFGGSMLNLAGVMMDRLLGIFFKWRETSMLVYDNYDKYPF